ncbi:MAG: hypothetical protein H0U49_03455 [Parachlamydiaceae bacterium]|nr:hypothetical protein [Parachlamydiaceae bacterium]
MVKFRPKSRHSQQSPSISVKANQVLNIILVAFVLILVRLWHLTIVQHEAREEESRRPQSRTVIESAKRGTIVDRFGLPLAVNRMQYNAAILYAPIRQIPSVRWEKDSSGQRIKRFLRKEYISKLSKLLAETLGLDAERLEDLIHSKGALYNQIPFILKDEISEREYYELKALERDWPGIQMQRLPRRHYPFGLVAGDIIGYMGAINRKEYENIIAEINFLQTALDTSFQSGESGEPKPMPEGFEHFDDIDQRLQLLKDKAYSLVDYVGKTGIEGKYERELRGSSGKKSYYSDARGNFLRELPGSRKAHSGNRLQLTIASELQEFAEKLLIQNEQIRETRMTLLDATQKKLLALKKPWIKGGAIVVMDPFTGEVITLASHPRYNPNDFILSGNPDLCKLQKANILRWFEAEGHIADIWDQRYPLTREHYDYTLKDISEEKKLLTWQIFLEMILPPGHPALKTLGNEMSIAKAIEINTTASMLLESVGSDDLLPVLTKLLAQDESMLQRLPASDLSMYKHHLEPVLKAMTTNDDRVLFIDLCRLAVDETRFTPSLIAAVGSQSLSEYRDTSAAMVTIEEFCQTMAKELFRDVYFANWRKENEKPFLKLKREEEKSQKRYAKPYIDLLDAKESELFKGFWFQNKWQLIETLLFGQPTESIDPAITPYLSYFSQWHTEISQGAHHELDSHQAYKKLQKALSAIVPSERIAYLQTLRGYRQLNRPLISSYSTLQKGKRQLLEKHLAAAFYPPYGFGYGRSQAYRQATTQGSIFKLVTAYEALIQKYNALGLESPSVSQLNPLTMVESFFTQAKESYMGYHADGKALPRFYKGGRLPRSTKNHLGKLDLLGAIEVSSNPYFSLLAGDILSSPNDMAAAASKFSYGKRTGIDLPAEISGQIPKDLETNRTGLYSMAIGQHTLVVTPLQTSVMLSALANGGTILTPHIVKGKSLSLKTKQLPMPTVVRRILLEGMHRVVVKSQGESLFSLSRLYRKHPEAISDYVDLKDQLLGKTGTAESIERLDLDKEKGIKIYNHVWFGGIAFEKSKELFVSKDPYGTPDLVVVVYLRYGGFGKEAGPIAAQIVSKWRELKAAHKIKKIH